MTRSIGTRQVTLRVSLTALALLTGCAGSRHPKVTGPPPEYEPPDLPDASFGAPDEPRRDASPR